MDTTKGTKIMSLYNRIFVLICDTYWGYMGKEEESGFNLQLYGASANCNWTLVLGQSNPLPSLNHGGWPLCNYSSASRFPIDIPYILKYKPNRI